MYGSVRSSPRLARKTDMSNNTHLENKMKKTSTAMMLALVSLAFAGHALAAPSEAKRAYDAAQVQAGANYKAARAECAAITGNPKDVCMAEAKAVRVHADASATAHYKNTLKAYTKARTQIADANYDLDKVRCAALTGNDKDVCIKQAKATKIAALADAKADKKVIEARADARADKRNAEYKVALEKCDALAGAAKDQCVSGAKSRIAK